MKKNYLNGLKNSKLITFKYGNKEYLTCEDCYFKFVSNVECDCGTHEEIINGVVVYYEKCR